MAGSRTIGSPAGPPNFNFHVAHPLRIRIEDRVHALGYIAGDRVVGLGEYALVSQDAMRVEWFTRDADWEREHREGLGADISESGWRYRAGVGSATGLKVKKQSGERN